MSVDVAFIPGVGLGIAVGSITAIAAMRNMRDQLRDLLAEVNGFDERPK
jgi:hypothetical protein